VIARQNVNITNSFLNTLPKLSSLESPYIWSNVPANEVISFLKGYKTHPNAPEVNSALLAHYIAQKASDGILTKWHVVFLSNNDKAEKLELSKEFIYPVRLFKRSNKYPDNHAKYTIQRLLSPEHEQFGLSKDIIQKAFNETILKWEQTLPEKRSENRPTYPSGPILRKLRPPEEGLLILYPLDSVQAELPYKTPTIGVGISFPGDKLNPTEGVEYEANMVYIGKELGDEDYD
jgi:hypothetical protein